MAVRAGLKLSEYGLFDLESGQLIVASAEEEVYAHLGLPWIRAAARTGTAMEINSFPDRLDPSD